MSRPTPKGPYRDAPLRSERPRSGGAWVALTALLLGAAGGLVRWQTRPAAPRQARSPALHPMRLHDAWVAARDPDGAVMVVRDGERLQIRPRAGVAERATVPFGSRVLSATPLGREWVFVAEDGSVAAAEGFLGAPRDLGHLPCATRVDRGSRGVATAVDVDGRLYTTDGSRPFAIARAPGPVRAAVFLSRELGAVILRDGGAAVSRDGGQNWDALDLQGDVGWAFERTSRCVELQTLTRVYCLDARGGLLAVPRVVAGEALPEGVREPLEADLPRSEPFRSPSVARCEPPGDPLPPRPGPRFACEVGEAIEALDDGLGGAAVTVRPCTQDPSLVRGAAHSVHGDVRGNGVVAPAGAAAHLVWRLAPRAEQLRTDLWNGEGDVIAPFRRDCDDAVTAVAATRAGVLLYNTELHRLVWGARDRGFSRVPEPLCDAELNAPLTGTTLAIALPDGGALALLSREVYRGGPTGAWDTTSGLVPWRETVGVALDVGPLGALRARRPGAFGRLVAGLARRGDVRGFVVKEGPALTLHPVDGGAPVTLPPLPSLCVAPCRGIDPTRWTVALPQGCATLDFGDATATVGAVELELGEAGACVRALNAAQGDDAPITLQASRDGGLAGTRAGTLRVVCAPEAEAPR